MVGLVFIGSAVVRVICEQTVVMLLLAATGDQTSEQLAVTQDFGSGLGNCEVATFLLALNI